MNKRNVEWFEDHSPAIPVKREELADSYVIDAQVKPSTYQARSSGTVTVGRNDGESSHRTRRHVGLNDVLNVLMQLLNPGNVKKIVRRAKDYKVRMLEECSEMRNLRSQDLLKSAMRSCAEGS